ncbi:MAG: DUF2334 domain-containing protein [archaeon]
MKKRKIKVSAAISAAIIFLLLTLFLIRAFSPRGLDDVSPGIECKGEFIEKSDVLWVIPNLEEKPISENGEWCRKILNLNKTIGMHGIDHTFREFETKRDQKYLEKGIKIFEECFGYKPTMFKPPQLRISEENKELTKKNNLILKSKLNQIFHKVYHCGEYGKRRNWLINLF